MKAVGGRGRRTGRPPEEAVGRLLMERGETLAVAESLTGGGLGERLTRVPGSSAWFLEGRVAYSEEAKKRLLGVPASLLRTRGAVSIECARAMAAGVRSRSGSDWGLSVTGVAGPGSAQGKPAGLVFAALAGPGVRRAWKQRISGGRARVRRGTIRRALEGLRRALQGKRTSGPRGAKI
jgi:PncC family amidohydrolase